MLDDPWFKSQQGKEICLLSQISTPALGPTQSPIQWGPGGSFTELKQQGHEIDHSPPTKAKVKNE